jgi:hypothetical protein
LSHAITTLLICLGLLALANYGSAQDRPSEAPGDPEGASGAETGSDPGEGEIASLGRGQRAPFAGLLIAQEDLVRWRLEIERLRFRLRVDLDALRARHVVETRLAEGRVEAADDRTELHDQLWEEQASGLAAELLEERVTHWYEHPILWYVLGVATVVAVAVAAVAL